MKKLLSNYKIIIIPLVAVLVLVWFFSAIVNLDKDKALEDKQNLEEALRRATVFCYAVEGAYPPSLEHITENYGVQIDEERYAVKYEPIASNLMPDITVLERKQ